MKKNDVYIHTIFLITTLLTAIPLGLFILMELFGYTTFNNFLKDHGSLIAGILGLIGVFILVRYQKRSTEQTVDATLRAIHLDSFEIRKRDCIKAIIKTMNNIDLISQDIDENLFKKLNKCFRYLSMYKYEEVKHLHFFIDTLWKYYSHIHDRSRESNIVSKEGVEEINELLYPLKKTVIFHLNKIPNEIKVSIEKQKPQFQNNFNGVLKQLISLEKVLKKSLNEEISWKKVVHTNNQDGFIIDPEYTNKIIDCLLTILVHLKTMQIVILNLEVNDNGK